MGEKLFFFHFEDPKDKERVFHRQSWTFNKAFLILQEFDGLHSASVVDLDWCPFWVRVFGLPFGLMNGKTGSVLGEQLVQFWKLIHVRIGLHGDVSFE